MPANIVLINPNLVVQRDDPFTTGIVYMPLSLAYVAAALRAAGERVTVIDAYGEAPFERRKQGKFMTLGLSETEVMARLPQEVQVAIIYAINLSNHNSTIALVKALRNAVPDLPIVILENTQAVTAYALAQVKHEFFQAGADYILTGEGEERAVRLCRLLAEGKSLQTIEDMQAAALDGVGSPSAYLAPQKTINDLDKLAFPAWDLFPLENYWKLRFAHAPQSAPRYLPLLTSRGCPYPCRFCVIPATNRHKWRSRSAENVVDEMEDAVRHFRVQEFHLEDVDPTVSDERTRQICREIIHRGLKVTWKIGSGTKVETLRDETTLDLMHQAGCRYISISPETGSASLLKLMNKPFNLEHAQNLVAHMQRVGIRSQACFILGFPGESDADRRLTWNLVRQLTRVGVDEIALFIIAPVPGAEIYPELPGYETLSDLTFSPTWRTDYATLSRFRLRLYLAFLFWKLCYHPLNILRQPVNFIRRRFETKMEMVPYRALVFKCLDMV